MNISKYLDTTKITARRKAQFMRDCQAAVDTHAVFELAKALAKETASKVPLEGTVKDLLLALYAVGLAVWKLERTDTVEAYMKQYIMWKLTIANRLGDTGAIGDAIETVIHLLAMRRNWRTQKRYLHVSIIGATDVRINKIRFEVGHNAKLWNDSTLSDAMNGPFEGVIYGMIDKQVMEGIIELIQKDFNKGLTELADMLYVFTDKDEFFRVMQNDLGRSPTIKYRPTIDKMITVYNGSKQNAWNRRMEGAEFPTLTEYMKSLGENDYLI